MGLFSPLVTGRANLRSAAVTDAHNCRHQLIVIIIVVVVVIRVVHVIVVVVVMVVVVVVLAMVDVVVGVIEDLIRIETMVVEGLNGKGERPVAALVAVASVGAVLDLEEAVRSDDGPTDLRR